MSVLKMTDLDLAGKRVLIREDLNVPIKDGKVASDKRIRASLPTIEHAMNAGARVMLMSHLGRPTEGEFAEEFSMRPVADHLSELLGKEVKLIADYLDNAPQMQDGDVVLLENVRFNPGEKKNDEALSRRYAALCDIYVMDAFGTAHRAQASTYGVGEHAPVACAGPLLAAELDALAKALDFVLRDPPHVLNLSLAGPDDPLVGRLIDDDHTLAGIALQLPELGPREMQRAMKDLRESLERQELEGLEKELEAVDNELADLAAQSGKHALHRIHDSQPAVPARQLPTASLVSR